MKCFSCGNKKDCNRYIVSEKEVRIMCSVCVQKSLNKDKKEVSNYTKASKLYHVKL